MNKIAVILLLSGSLLVVGCSRSTTDTTAGANPTPSQKSEKEQRVKAKTVEAKPLKAEPKGDQPILAVSPSPSDSAPQP
jgi:PBP1b-binding outer membrane lipoprotein LpoB